MTTKKKPYANLEAWIVKTVITLGIFLIAMPVLLFLATYVGQGPRSHSLDSHHSRARKNYDDQMQARKWAELREESGLPASTSK